MSVTFDKILGTMREDNTSEIDAELALKQDKVQNNLTAIVDPTVNDDSADGYEVFSIWYNTATQEMFKCMNATVGAAVWLLTTLTLDDLGSMATETATNYYTKTDADILLGNKSSKTQKDYIQLYAGDFYDGVTPPDTSELIVSNGKLLVRQFSGVTDQDVTFTFIAPTNLSAGTVKFRFQGIVTNAIAPTVGQTIILGLKGCSIGDSELISKAPGTEIKTTYTAPADLAQYDIVNSIFSADITITDLIGGELVKFVLTRDTATDTYGQKIGISGVEIEYTKTVLA